MEQLEDLVANSFYCEQTISYSCSDAPLVLDEPYGWYGLNGERVAYWGGNTGEIKAPPLPLCALLTLTVLVTTIDAQWEGMGDVGSARYEPALLPPCPTIRVLSYSN